MRLWRKTKKKKLYNFQWFMNLKAFYKINCTNICTNREFSLKFDFFPIIHAIFTWIKIFNEMYFSLLVEKHSNKTILFFHFMFEDPLTTKKKNEPKKGKKKERKPLYSFIYMFPHIYILYIYNYYIQLLTHVVN